MSSSIKLPVLLELDSFDKKEYDDGLKNYTYIGTKSGNTILHIIAMAPQRFDEFKKTIIYILINKLIDINTYSDDDLIKAKGALPKVLLMEKNSNQLEKGIKQIEKCNFTKEEREIISVYITNIIGEINPKLAKEMLENINKNEEGKGMRLGQALVDYYYDGVTKGEKKRSKENSNKSNKKNAKRKL